MAKDIMLLQLTAENFKGIKYGIYDLDAKIVNVYGANASGKTTMLDAYRYLFFGKDHADRSDFQRRPTDEDGKQVDNIEIMVAGRIRVADEEIELKKVERQNWVKRHGDVEKTLAGNVTDYYINGFPTSQKAYKEKIESIIGEDAFKIKTDPRYFPSLKWQTQRQLLFQTETEISDADILLMDPELFKPIRCDILAGGIDATRIKHNGILKKLKELQASYPIRIDEVSKSIVEVDVPALTAKKEEFEEQLRIIRASMAGLIDNSSTIKRMQAAVMQARLDAEGLRQEAYTEYQKARNAKRAEISAKESEVSVLTANLTGIERTRDALSDGLKYDEKLIETITNDYKEANGRRLAVNATICPTCGREFQADRVAIIRDNFETNRKTAIDRALIAGKACRKRIDDAKAKIDECTAEVIALTEKIRKANEETEVLRDEFNHMVEPDMSGNEAYADCMRKIQDLECNLETMDTSDATQTYSEQAKTAKEELEQVNAQLAMVDANERAKKRIAELQEEQRINGQQVADEEMVIYALDEFVKLKMNTLSDRINSKFKHVRFKLFEQLINGGLKETCVMMVESNGSYVNFSDGNNAAQVQGGLDVIDALSELDGIHAPVWLDNRESVSEIPEVKSQVINLIVSPDDKELRIVKEG